MLRLFFLPGPDFQSKTSVPLIISTETELMWNSASSAATVQHSLLIYSSECILNSLVFQEIELGYIIQNGAI